MPKIKFKNFRETWKQVTLENIVKIKIGGDKPKIFEKHKTISNNIPVIGNGLKEDSIYGYTNKCKIFPPCVSISARGTIGFPQIQNFPFFPIVRLVCLLPTKNNSHIFLKYCLDRLDFTCSVSGIPQLTSEYVKKMNIFTTSLQEQNKISSLFLKLENLLQNFENKLLKFNKIKNSLLLNMLI